jgi:ABC-type phosphate transport system substrate-binding protein
MKHGNLTTRTKVLAGAVLLCMGMVAAGTAAAATDTFGGGATLPAGAYVGFNFIGAANPVLSSNTLTQFASQNPSAVGSTSLLGVWAANTGNKVSYCQTGSGNGKKIFNHNDGLGGAPISAGACAGGLTGFAAPSGVAVDPYFAGSDAPMSATEYGQFGTATTGKGPQYGQPSQFPAVAGTIAIIYNNADAPQGTLTLTDEQICKVLNRTFTNWQDLDPTLPSKAIKLVYRSDGSGTTFSLSNHLTSPISGAVCTGTAAKHFITDQAFTTVVSLFGIPATGWTGANGNGGVITEMNLAREDGAISYSESANLKAAKAAGLGANISYATVNGKDPYVDFPNTVSVTALKNFGITGVNPTTGVPTIGAIAPLVSGSQCLNFVSPATYANVTSRYPIMAVSYLITNYKGNTTADVGAVQSLITSLYDVANAGAHVGVKTIGNDTTHTPAVNGVQTGFAFVSPTVAINSNACINI